MAIDADVLRAMAAAGATIEVIIAAVEADAAKEAQRVEIKREKDAERQRKSRRNRGLSRDVTVTERDNGDITEIPAPSLSPQTPQTHPHPSNNKPARVRAHRLPSDWQPEAFTGEVGKAVAVWPPGALERELARFRDWAASASGPNATKTDWQAAWRNWIRKADDEGRYAKANTAHRSAGADPQADYLRTLLSKQAAGARVATG